MARPGLEKNVKFKRLVLMLKMPRPHVRGHLETLWEVAYECGEPRIGDSDSIEAAAEWHGEPGILFQALLSCGGPGRAGFIEDCPDSQGEYQIRDLWDHAPEYVQKRRKREDERKSKNTNSTDRRSADNGGQRQISAENGAPPSPPHSPSPAPSPPHSHKRSVYSVNKGQQTDETDHVKRFSVEELQSTVDRLSALSGCSNYGDEFYQAAAFHACSWLTEADLASISNGTKLNAKTNRRAYFHKLLWEVLKRRKHEYANLLKRCSCQGGWPTGPPKNQTVERVSHQDFPTIGAMDRDDEPTLA